MIEVRDATLQDAKRILEICDKINSDAVYLCKLQNCQRCEYSKICPRS